MSWIIHLPILIAIALFCRSRWKEKPLADFFLPGLLLKLIAGTALGLIYKYYYNGGDTFELFRYAEEVSALIRKDFADYISLLLGGKTEDPSLASLQLYQPRVLSFALYLAPLNFICLANYWIASLYLSLFSYLALFRLAGKICIKFSIPPGLTAFAFLIFPSMVFWSSGYIKESITWAFMALLLYIFLDFTEARFSPGKLVLMLLSAYIVHSMKFYVSLVLLPCLGFIWGFSIAERYGISRWIALAAICLPAGLFVLFNPYVKGGMLLQHILANHDATILLSEGRNIILFEGLKPEAGSFLKHFPKALISGLFRPFIWEARADISVFPAMENCLILLLCIGALPSIRNFRMNISGLFVATTLLYVIILAAFLAFSSPNLGTLARYKVYFLPFFLLLLGLKNPLLGRLYRLLPEKWRRRYFTAPVNEENV